MRFITCLLMLLLVLTGCTADSQSPEPAQITLTPVDLFKGEAKKFKPFLGNMSGAFNLSYTGNKPTANLDIDIWEKGEKVSSVCSIIDLFYEFENSKSEEIEMIVSINTISSEGENDLNEIKLSIMRDNGVNTYTCSNEWDNDLTGKGLINMGETYTFIAENDVHLWGMQATSTNSMYTADFSPESLNKLEAAIILTLHFEDENNK